MFDLISSFYVLFLLRPKKPCRYIHTQHMGRGGGTLGQAEDGICQALNRPVLLYIGHQLYKQV